MTQKNSYAYVEIQFNDTTKDYFFDLTNKLVPSDYFYKSPIIESINGNKSKSLHVTVFFGLNPIQKDNPELNELIQSFKLEDIKLDNFFFFEGYQGMYKVLCIRVLDEDNKLFKLSKAIAEFSEDKTFIEREFKPHITLAYVTNEFRLPANLPEFNKSIEPSNIKISI